MQDEDVDVKRKVVSLQEPLSISPFSIYISLCCFSYTNTDHRDAVYFCPNKICLCIFALSLLYSHVSSVSVLFLFQPYMLLYGSEKNKFKAPEIGRRACM